MAKRMWLLGALTVAALTAAACGGGDEGTQTSTSTVTSTSTSTVAAPPPPAATTSTTSLLPGVPNPVLEPFVLTRNGDSVTVAGDVPEQATRTAVLDAITAAVGTDANVIDTMQVNPGSMPFDTAQVTAVLQAAKPIANFGLRRDPDKVTLTGAAPAEADRAAAETAAKALFPDVGVVNQITVP
ncbi:BON domain-containing protein [Mycobacterium sp. MYCO198283]|uniref:channel-forming protein ArfA/OmpATb n=1 Tax=Mycobacterium sp. MYCO198283 TaxID=2883505 RepID=UPI001E4FC0C9|nr:BON domain-containing protein [Mycobacterium sp. MYCO198283]MCG5431121.1 BON domain-containing protein [Mycobacterium sp. MYCO198283]